MILLIDVGNTSTTLGLWDGAQVIKTGRVPTTQREAAVVLAEVRRWLGRRTPADAVLSTVVPAVRPLWRKVCGALGVREPLEVSHKLKLGVKISYPDRRASALIVWRMLPPWSRATARRRSWWILARRRPSM